PEVLSSSDDLRLPDVEEEALLVLSSVHPAVPAAQLDEFAEVGVAEIAIRDSASAETPDSRRFVRFMFFFLLQT
ncbi:MAG: hypothetical protein ACK59B_03160, partial [Alphaproteobacteria bacterium]